MDFENISSFKEVIDSLTAIEDKIYERGMLVSLTDDPEATLSIRFESYLSESSNEAEPLVVIRISSNLGEGFVDGQLDRIADYVNEKIDDCQANWPPEARAAYQESFGQIILFNGKQVY